MKYSACQLHILMHVSYISISSKCLTKHKPKFCYLQCYIKLITIKIGLQLIEHLTYGVYCFMPTAVTMEPPRPPTRPQLTALSLVDVQKSATRHRSPCTLTTLPSIFHRQTSLQSQPERKRQMRCMSCPLSWLRVD